MEVDSTAEGALQTQDDNQQRKVQVFRYKEEERQEFVSQAVTSISFFPANVAIQKVRGFDVFPRPANFFFLSCRQLRDKSMVCNI